MPGSLVGVLFDDAPGADPLTALLALHALLGVGLLAGGQRLARRAFAVAAVAPAVALGWAAWRAGEVLDGAVPAEAATWVAGLGLELELRLDGFALLLVAMVAGIGCLVQLYAGRYFAAGRPGLHRLAGLLLLFTAAMFGVVTAANLLVLYVAWELTSVTSYLLIGWTDEDAGARAAALQALLTTGAGGLAMLGGFVLIGQAAGTYDLAALAAAPPDGTAVQVGLVLVLLGAFTKSAQFPFSAWLPGAMVAPTPVSAFLHSATMVKAGVYLVARLAPVFAGQPVWRPLVLTVGLVTMLLGGWRALRQYDLKRMLAHGTVSQLGFMVTLFGAGVPEATLAGVVVLVAHALFKACLFLVVGVIDHQAHTRDIRALGRFGPGWGGVRAVAVVAGASMAGVPLLFGFVAKEAAYEAFAHGPFAAGPVVLAALVAGSVLTFAYTGRLLLGAFRPGAGRERPVPGDEIRPVDHPPAPALASWWPPALLALVTVALGVLPALADDLVSVAAHSLDPQVDHAHLALWHGWTLPLALSALTVGTGAVLVHAGDRLARIQRRLPHPVDGDRAYLGTVRSLNRLADRVTGMVQPGSLPRYAGIILATAVLLPGWALLRVPAPARPPLTSSPGEWAAAALIVAGAVAAATVRERVGAVLCLGAVGYGMALVFVVQGAPDLALTQVAVDTLAVVAFVLVLRRLPGRFAERPTRVGRGLRLAVSAAVGVFVFAFILVAGDARVDVPVSTEFVERALPDGGGRNVVNVVLVDIRGFDTLGEITVLSVAALGVYGLARRSAGDRRSVGEGER